MRLKMRKEQTVRRLTRLCWRLAPRQTWVNMDSGCFLKSFRQKKNSKAFELHPISWIFIVQLIGCSCFSLYCFVLALIT